MPRITASPALSHLRVLDLTRVRAGPTCVRLLADFGADVIKIEAPPGTDGTEGIGGPRHGFDMQNLHRNKRSMTLNLKTPDGLAIFKKLVANADVVVENYRPDVKARLGIGYEDLRAINKRIILASISGFGETGPYRDRAGLDQIAQGMGGLMWVTGRPGEGPMRAGIAIADSSAGNYAAIGILIALAERERSGEGQWITTSLLQAQIAMMDFQAARYLVDGEVPPQAGNDHPYVTPTGAFETADGYINIALGQKQWPDFCRVLGRTDLTDHPDYATQDLRFRHRPQLNCEIAAALKTRPTRDWLAELDPLGIPAGPIYHVDEMFEDPQVRHLGMAAPLHHPVRGDIRVVGTPVNLSRTPAKVVTPTPEPGAHTAEILAEIGIAGADVDRLRASKTI
ncbi:MAG TPA: CoA transferase [Xanthobacteraceae bacterium]|nr:CoA transferase [Xanthobacteraceae bacterium]